MLKHLMKALTIILVISFSSVSFAEPLITNLSQGQKAPWVGTLFNSEAVAKTIAETETLLNRCKNDASAELARATAKHDLFLSNAKVTNVFQQKKI